jgi:hypothetical protein
MPRPEPQQEVALRRVELLRGIGTRAQGIDTALTTLLACLTYLEGELAVARSLQHVLAELREAALESHTLAREIVALGRDKAASDDG